MSKPPGAKIPVLAVVLFGSPGSGKGTQAKLLVECLGIPQISTGDMLRDACPPGNAVGHQAVESKLKAGILVTDEVVNRWWKSGWPNPMLARVYPGRISADRGAGREAVRVLELPGNAARW